MILNILEYLEAAARRAPDHAAFDAPEESLTWGQLNEKAKAVGACLCGVLPRQKPVLILMDKRPLCLAAMLGAVWAGCFYTPLDTAMPAARMRLIASVLKPGVILIYSTCTIDPAENEENADYIEKELGLTPDPVDAFLPAGLFSGQEKGRCRLQLLPHVHHTDGFFIARFING